MIKSKWLVVCGVMMASAYGFALSYGYEESAVPTTQEESCDLTLCGKPCANEGEHCHPPTPTGHMTCLNGTWLCT